MEKIKSRDLFNLQLARLLVTVCFIYFLSEIETNRIIAPLSIFQSKYEIRTAPNNQLNIWWQMVPYLVLTFGEVLFSITGYEFSYSQVWTPKKCQLAVKSVSW